MTASNVDPMAIKLDRNSAQYHILRGEVTLLKNLRCVLLVAVVAVESCSVVGRVDEEYSERVVVDTPTLLPPPLVLPPMMEVVVVMLLGP